MTLLLALGGLLALLFCIALPGGLAVTLLDDGDLLWRLGLGLGTGLLAVPSLAFLAAMLLQRSLGLGLLIGVAAGVNGALLFLLLRRREGRDQ